MFHCVGAFYQGGVFALLVFALVIDIPYVPFSKKVKHFFNINYAYHRSL